MLKIYFIFIIFAVIDNNLSSSEETNNVHLILKNINYVPSKRQTDNGFDILDFSVYLPRSALLDSKDQHATLTASFDDKRVRKGSKRPRLQPLTMPYIRNTIQEARLKNIPSTDSLPHFEALTSFNPSKSKSPFTLSNVRTTKKKPTEENNFNRNVLNIKSVMYTNVEPPTLNGYKDSEIRPTKPTSFDDQAKKVEAYFTTKSTPDDFPHFEALTATRPHIEELISFNEKPQAGLRTFKPSTFEPITTPITKLQYQSPKYTKISTYPTKKGVIRPHITVLNYTAERDLTALRPVQSSRFESDIIPTSRPVTGSNQFPRFEALTASKDDQNSYFNKDNEPTSEEHNSEEASPYEGLIHNSPPKKEVLFNSVVYHPDRYTGAIYTKTLKNHSPVKSYEYHVKDTSEKPHHSPASITLPAFYIHVANDHRRTARMDTQASVRRDTTIKPLPYQGVFKTISSYVTNRTDEDEGANKRVIQREPTTPSPAEKAVNDEIQYFQDIFIGQNSPHELEFGHIVDGPLGSEERFERKDMKGNRHQGKVRWTDKRGGYGEHYWDLGHNNQST